MIIVQLGIYCGKRGWVVATHPELMYSVRVWARADGADERILLIVLHRSKIKMQG